MHCTLVMHIVFFPYILPQQWNEDYYKLELHRKKFPCQSEFEIGTRHPLCAAKIRQRSKILHIDMEWNATGLAKRAQMFSGKLNEFLLIGFVLRHLSATRKPGITRMQSSQLTWRISQLLLGQGMETKDSDRPQIKATVSHFTVKSETCLLHNILNNSGRL